VPAEENKAIAGRWFTESWGKEFNPAVLGELAAPDIRFGYSLHEPLRGRDAVRAFAEKFRAAFPDLGFRGTAGLIAEGDYVAGQWEGGGTHAGGAFDDVPYGPLPAGTGKVLRFTGTTVLKAENGLITAETGQPRDKVRGRPRSVAQQPSRPLMDHNKTRRRLLGL
jgi:predicted ester cyclase